MSKSKIETGPKAGRRSLKTILLGAAMATGMLAAPVLPAGAQQEPIKVGLLLTYVGPTALFARYEAKGAQLHIDQVNAAGGINGRKIELVNYDTEGKPDRAGSLFRRLAQEDKVSAVIGPDSIFVLNGMSSVPREVGVLSVAAPGNYELIDPKNRTHVVSAWASYGFVQGLGGIAYMAEKYKVKRLGMVSTSDAIGEMLAQEMAASAKLVGAEMVQVVSQPASDRDMLPSLRKLATMQPPIDGLVIWGSGPFGTITMNQTELAGIKVPIAYIGGNVIPELIKELSPDTGKRTFFATSRNAVFDTLPKTDPSYDRVQKFVADYKAKYNGEVPAMPAGVGYDMALAVTNAIKAVGTNPEKIAEYVTTKQKDLIGAQGVAFNRTRGYGYGSDPTDNVIVAIEGGKFVFKGYMKDSLKNLQVQDESVRQQLRAFKIMTE